MALTKAERETVILMNDEDDIVRVCSAQAPVIRKCRKDSNFTEISVITEDGVEWVEFTIEKRLFRFSSKRKSNLTPEQRQAAAERLRNARS